MQFKFIYKYTFEDIQVELTASFEYFSLPSRFINRNIHITYITLNNLKKINEIKSIKFLNYPRNF